MKIQSMRRRLQGHEANGQTFSHLDLRSLQAFQSKWRGCMFQTCKLGLSFFKGSIFAGSQADQCDAPLCDFSGSVIEDMTFSACVLDQCSFAGAVLSRVKFVDCQLSLSVFAGATLSNVEFVRCNLYSADLDILEGKGNEFFDCNLWGARMATNCQFWNSKIDEKTCRMFVAMIARVFPAGEKKDLLLEVAGDEYALVDRLMGDPEAG